MRVLSNYQNLTYQWGIVSIADISKHSIGGIGGRASEYTSGHGVNVLGNPSSRDLIALPAGSEGLY